MAKIVIDAGHGGRDPGAVHDGRQEKEDNLRLAMEVGRRLADQGVDVVYTRTGDIYQTPLEKARISNEENPDFLVSIHRNSSPRDNQYSGVETLVYNLSGEKVEMAENINRELERLGFKNLGVEERPDLIILRRSSAPALLVEAGFLNSDQDNEIFDSRFGEVAQAIADGILLTLGENGGQEYYRVQTGAFRNPEYAQDMLYRLTQQGYPAFVVQDGDLYKVQVGAFEVLDNAIKMEAVLRRQGYPTYLVKE
ncbi:MAG: N-acetylmuramoyl-L-alanine amidase [Lachnospiraceae bacterium]|nr:N-acetylmuramoyl-L-alanine amidase [Lachnospiraceae bacterium]